MTKRHFIAVAAAIEMQSRVTYPTNPGAQQTRAQALYDVACQLAQNFAGENPRFDRDSVSGRLRIWRERRPVMARCFFASCKAPITHTVQRLWLVGRKRPPLLHCCAQHVPGSKAKPGTPAFYDVQPIVKGGR